MLLTSHIMDDNYIPSDATVIPCHALFQLISVPPTDDIIGSNPLGHGILLQDMYITLSNPTTPTPLPFQDIQFVISTVVHLWYNPWCSDGWHLQSLIPEYFRSLISVRFGQETPHMTPQLVYLRHVDFLRRSNKSC